MRNAEEEWEHGLKMYSEEIWLWYAQILDPSRCLQPATWSSSQAIWKLKTQNTEDRGARLMEKETGVVSG